MVERFLFGGIGAALTGVVLIVSGAFGVENAPPPADPTPVIGAEVPELPAGSHTCKDDFKAVELDDKDDRDGNGDTKVYLCASDNHDPNRVIRVYLNSDGSFAYGRVGIDGPFIFDEGAVPEWGD
jgi:hypothetical protein